MKPQLEAGKAKLQKMFPGKTIGEALSAEKKEDKIAHSLGVKLAAWDTGLEVDFTEAELKILG